MTSVLHDDVAWCKCSCLFLNPHEFSFTTFLEQWLGKDIGCTFFALVVVSVYFGYVVFSKNLRKRRSDKQVKCYYKNLSCCVSIPVRPGISGEGVVDQCVPSYSYIGPAVRFNPEYLDRRRAPDHRAGVAVQTGPLVYLNYLYER